MDTTHRGAAVNKVLDEETINKADLARKLGKDYKTLWRWLNDPEMDWDKIKLIGLEIGYDFSEIFEEMPVPRHKHNQTTEKEVVYGSLQGKSLAEVTGLYYSLLNNYNEMVIKYGDVVNELHIYRTKYGALK